MIPSVEEVIRAWDFVARRHGIVAEVRLASVTAALELAEACLDEEEGGEREVPAAVFFGLARYPRAFTAGSHLAPGAFARSLVHQQGSLLRATQTDVRRLATAVALRESDCLGVRRWFESRRIDRGQ